MPRLIDLIRRGKIYPPPGYRSDEPAVGWMRRYERQMLDMAQVFVVDNVSDYLYAGTPQEVWDETLDFPNVAPPFPVFWMEWKRPPRIVSEVHGITGTEGHADMTGVLFRVIKVDGENGVRDTINRWFPVDNPIAASIRVARSIEFLKKDRVGPPRWLLHASIYVQDKRIYNDGLPMGPMFEYLNTIDEHGRMTGGPSMLIPMPQELVDGNGHMFSGTIFPALLALSFLHCKNVHLETHETPVRLARSIEKRHGTAPVTYKTLVIEPMTKQIRGVRDKGDTGRQMSFHVIRGRFRTYTEERPLFGKHAGTWWWDDYVRGDASVGIVKKDYEVLTPRLT